MKCIQCLKTNKVVRVANEKAVKLVGNVTHKYVSKELWKKTGRNY